MCLVKAAATAVAVAATASPSGAQEVPDTEIIRASFDLAMRDLFAGDPARAIPLLRGILGRDPDLVRVRVRLELARAYFEAREFSRARQQFQLVLSSSNLPPAVRENVLLFLRRIDEERGLQTQLRFSIAAPTGASRRYDSDTVMVDLFGTPLPFEISRPEIPGTSLQIEGSARKQWSLGSEILSGRSAVYFRGRSLLQEAENNQFDHQEVELAAGAQLTWPMQMAYTELVGGATGFAGRLYETRTGLGFGYRARDAAGRALFTSVHFFDSDYAEGTVRDGQLFVIEAGLSRPFLAKGVISFTLGAENFDASRDDYSYVNVEARFTHSMDVSGGFSLTTSAFAVAFGQDQSTPGLSEPRDEIEYGIDVRIEKNDFFIGGRYTPYFEVGFSRRNSTIDAFAYHDASVEMGVSSAF